MILALKLDFKETGNTLYVKCKHQFQRRNYLKSIYCICFFHRPMTIEVNIKNLAKHTKMISKSNMNLIFKLLFNIHPLSCLMTIFYSVSHFMYTVIVFNRIYNYSINATRILWGVIKFPIYM